MSRERRKQEAARPLDQRKVRLRRKVWKDGEARIPGLLVGVGVAQAFVTPAAALELADRLVDMAEAAEAIEREPASLPGVPEDSPASTPATDAA